MKSEAEFLARLERECSQWGDVLALLQELPDADRADVIKYLIITHQEQKVLGEVVATIAQRIACEALGLKLSPRLE
jgi:Trp operon repressor